MQRNDLELVACLAEKLRIAVRHVSMRGSVKSIPPNLVTLVIGVRNCVEERFARQPMVKRRVEHCYVLRMWRGQTAGIIAAHIGGIVQRSKLEIVLDLA